MDAYCGWGRNMEVSGKEKGMMMTMCMYEFVLVYALEVVYVCYVK